MTNVRVPAIWIAQGYHPRVCARHGVEATAATPRSFHTKDSAWLLLLLVIPLLMVIVGLAIRKTVTGPMLSCDVCAGDQKRDAYLLGGTWVLTVVLLAVAIAMSSAPVAVAFTVAFLVGLVLLLRKDRNRVAGTFDKDQTWVELRGVHPTYARLVFQAVHQPLAAPLEGYGPVGAPPAAQAIDAPAPTAYVPAAAGATILPASKHGRPAAVEDALLGEQSPQ